MKKIASYAGIDRGIDSTPHRQTVHVPFDEQAIEHAKTAHFSPVAESVLGPIDFEILAEVFQR
jgi:hypothetical protein